MTKRKGLAKGRSESGSFLGIPKQVLESKNYLALSPHAIKLLIDIAMQYRGSNNGDLQATISLMRLRGWKSTSTLYKALSDLERLGFIEKTRQGGRNRCNLFAITWRPIDECPRAFLDMHPTNVASNLWKGSPPPKEVRLETHALTTNQPSSTGESQSLGKRTTNISQVWGANQSKPARKLH